MSPESGIPPAVRKLISKHIHSLEQLEVLLLLYRSPEREWTVQEVNEHIRSSDVSIAGRLEGLQAAGFLVLNASQPSGPSYRFSPRSEELRRSVPVLAGAYQEMRLQVIELIFGRSSASLREFSNAFKIRKDKA